MISDDWENFSGIIQIDLFTILDDKMNIEKAKRLLAKMNVLVDHAGEGLSTLEQDLLKNYAQQLYQISGGSLEAKEEEKPSTRPVEPIAPKVMETPAVVKTPQASEPERDFIPKEISENAIDESQSDELESAEIEIPDHDAVEIPDEIEGNIEEKVGEAAEVHQVIAKPIMHQNGDGKLAPLFEIKKGSDLLAKLSDKPLEKVEHGMGLNEKIFTINELFGGDQHLFQTTMTALNEAENFDQAKMFLIQNVAKTQDWSAPEKVEMVEKFVQLVYRRFV